MSRILRVNGADGDPVGTTDSSKGVKRLIGGLDPGRYHVDEITPARYRQGHTSRRWEVGTKHPDGTIALDRDPWPRRT